MLFSLNLLKYKYIMPTLNKPKKQLSKTFNRKDRQKIYQSTI